MKSALARSIFPVDGSYDVDQSAKNRSRNASSDEAGKNEIFQLQLEQRDHDDKYHPEIARLDIHHRLNHMALHFAKYAGRIADALLTGDHSDINRTLTDIFIIALSSANVLNLHLGEALVDIEEIVIPQQDYSLAQEEGITQLLLAFTSASGRMAKACESLDHLESMSYREEICASVIDLSSTAKLGAVARNINLIDSVRLRLENVRGSKIFHNSI